MINRAYYLNQIISKCGMVILKLSRVLEDTKMNSELNSLKLIKDFFKKIIIRNDIISSFYDENGILHANLIDFLLEKIDLLK